MLILTVGSAFSLVLALLSPPPGSGGASPVVRSRLGSRPPESRDVLTQHNDNARSGAYLVERELAPQTVRSGRFHRLYARRVDGDILAQPLYAREVATPHRGVKNLVFVATAKNWLYAFDADEPSADPGAGITWSVSLGPSRQLRRATCTTPGSTDCDTRDGGEICAETYNVHRAAGWPLDGFQAFFNTWHSDPRQPDCPYNQMVDRCYVDPAPYGPAERFGPNIHGGPVYWERPRLGYGLIYQMTEKDFLKAFTYDLRTHRVPEQPRMTARLRPPDCMPGGFSSLSADGDADGIVWTSLATADAHDPRRALERSSHGGETPAGALSSAGRG
jgi:hypothetical protein